MTADLIARLEAATGADRELDVLLHAVANNATAEWQEYAKDWSYHRDGSWVSVGQAKAYTASIDCALTLFKSSDGYGALHMFWFENMGSTVHIFAHENADEGDGEFKVNHKSLPIALCIAALRARLPLETDGT